MKILIVEDEFVSRTLLQEILEPYGVCHAASNGLECLAAYRKALDENTPYDLMCLDIMMPELDGQEALKQIRQIEKERGIGGKDLVKVIMVTALGDAKTFMKGQCEAYLTKPIDSDKVIATCSKLGLLG